MFCVVTPRCVPAGHNLGPILCAPVFAGRSLLVTTLWFTVTMVVYQPLVMASCHVTMSCCVTARQYLWPCVYVTALDVCQSLLVASYNVAKFLLLRPSTSGGHILWGPVYTCDCQLITLT